MGKPLISNWFFMKTTLIYPQRLRKTIFQTRIEIRKFRVQKGFEMSNACLIQCRNSAGKNLNRCGSKIKIHGKPLISNWFFMKTTLIYTHGLRKTIFQIRIEIRKFRVQKCFETSNAWLIEWRNSDISILYFENVRWKNDTKISILNADLFRSVFFFFFFFSFGWEKLFFKEE